MLVVKLEMNYIIYNILAIVASVLCFQKFIFLAQKISLIDNKNKNYAFGATVTGSGIIFLIIFLLGNIFFWFFDSSFSQLIPNRYYLFLISIIFLSIISLRDDIRPIDPIMRLAAQLFFIYLSITSLKLNLIPLPDKFVFLSAVLIWIYIMNISNFIDGSDGFLITTFIFYNLGIIFLSIFFDLNIFSKYIALICLPFSLVFLFFNKPPAKIFMGDAGSIFIGFISGFYLLELLIADKWYLAISLMAYKIVDCSYCLLRKLKKGIMPWIGLYDYFFLIPILKNKINHINVLILQIIFFITNFFIIFFQEYFNIKYLFVLSLILSGLVCIIYKNLENVFTFLKFKK